jgi:hypothetical protein
VLATVIGTAGIVVIVMLAPKYWYRIRELLRSANKKIKKGLGRSGKKDAKESDSASVEPNEATEKENPEGNGQDTEEAGAKPKTEWWHLRRRPKQRQTGEA